MMKYVYEECSHMNERIDMFNGNVNKERCNERLMKGITGIQYCPNRHTEITRVTFKEIEDFKKAINLREEQGITDEELIGIYLSKERNIEGFEINTFLKQDDYYIVKLETQPTSPKEYWYKENKNG